MKIISNIGEFQSIHCWNWDYKINYLNMNKVKKEKIE